MSSMTTSTSPNLNDHGAPAFTYFVSYVLRNVVPARRVAEVCGDISIGRWLSQNRHTRIWSFTTSQLLKIDIKSISKLPPEVIVGHNPFKGLKISEIEVALQVFDTASLACLLAIPNNDHHEVLPQVGYSVDKWREILGQLGATIVIHHNTQWSLFLVLK